MLRYAGENIASASYGHATGCVYADQDRDILLIVDALHEAVGSHYFVTNILPLLRARLERETGSLEERIREAITLANNDLFATGQEQGDTKNMACSITAIIVDQAETAIGHVGNTVAYLINPYTIKRVTPEHQLNGMTKPSFNSTSEEAESVTILSEPVVVGTEEHEPEDHQFIYFNRFNFTPDSALLLCSHSLSACLPPEAIFHIVRQQPGNRTRVVQALIQAATTAGCEGSFSVLFAEERKFASALRAQHQSESRAHAEHSRR